MAINIGQANFKTILNDLSQTMFSLDVVNSSSDIVQEFKNVVNGIMEEIGKPNIC